MNALSCLIYFSLPVPALAAGTAFAAISPAVFRPREARGVFIKKLRPLINAGGAFWFSFALPLPKACA